MIIHSDSASFFSPIANLSGIPVDQVNFIFCCLTATIVGQLQRKLITEENRNESWRMFIELLMGILLSYFCFGQQIINIVIQATISLLILKVLPINYASVIASLWSLGILIVSHAYRQYSDYGSYVLDITGPMMIMTQKLSSLAFNLRDGERLNNGVQVKEVLKRHAVTKFPTLLQFYSYCFNCHSVMSGPFVFFSEYMAYMNCYGLREMPSARKQMTVNAALIVVHALLTACIAPQVPYQVVVSAEFQNYPMTRKLIYTTISFLMIRQRYYCAWKLGETAGVSAGIGFSGFERNGDATWETIKNCDYAKIEAGNSIKVIIDGWNIKTTHWLRELIYERAPSSIRLMLSFVCSAIWHGFYPGYYLMFGSFALFTVTSRIMRRNARPYFQQTLIKAKAYDVLTTIVANLTMNYVEGPFHLLELQSGLIFWKAFYFFPHSVALFIILCSYLIPKNGAINVENLRKIE